MTTRYYNQDDPHRVSKIFLDIVCGAIYIVALVIVFGVYYALSTGTGPQMW